MRAPAARPLARWDDGASVHADLVWWSRLDARWQVEVHRLRSYRGELVVFDHRDGDRVALRREVGLSFDARFGPDVADVAEWQTLVAAFVDRSAAASARPAKAGAESSRRYAKRGAR